MCLYLLGLVPMLAAAPELGRHFEDDRIVALLWILGGTMCVSPFRYVLRARVNAELKFGSNAIATLVNNFATYPLQILIAIVYRDPVALALPVLVGSIAEVIYLWAVARPHRCDFIPRRRFVLPVIRELRWLLCVAAMMSRSGRAATRPSPSSWCRPRSSAPTSSATSSRSNRDACSPRR